MREKEVIGNNWFMEVKEYGRLWTRRKWKKKDRTLKHEEQTGFEWGDWDS